jgi:hypothetical protein
MANYWIGEDFIKSNTPLTQNTDAKDIIPFVATASDMFVQPLLGSYFYNILLAKYNAQTLNSDEEQLVLLIKPVVAWRAAADAVYALTYQLKNKGLVTQNGENSDPADPEQVVMIKRHYDQKAEHYTERVIKHLIINKDLFPEFTAKENNDCSITDMLPQKDSGYNQDMLMI